MTDPDSVSVVLGAGPVGRAVVGLLVERGQTPVIVTRSATEVAGATAVGADLARPDQAKSVLADAALVYQCAQPPYDRWEVEFPGLQRSVLSGCEAAGATLIAVENLYGYGPSPGPLVETEPMRPTTGKGRVRAAMAEELLTAHRAGIVPTAAVRASDFIGPGVTQSAFGERFFGPILGGGRAELLGPPGWRHSVTFVPDLARALVDVAGDPGARGRAWHAPNAPAVAVGELVDLAARIAGTGARHRVVAPWQLRLFGLFAPAARELIEMLYQHRQDFVVDSSDFEIRFGWSATPIGDAVARTVAWYRDRAES